MSSIPSSHDPSLGTLNDNHQPPTMSLADAAAFGMPTALPPSAPPSGGGAPPPPLLPLSSGGDGDKPAQPGRLLLNPAALRRLRKARVMSQQDLADDCWRRNIRVSLATIKRAESGHAVRYRVARELARCFDVPVVRLLDASHKQEIVMDDRNAFLIAIQDTLMHIAGVSGTAAKRLRPGQSLEVDLGLDVPDFVVLAAYQNGVAARLRGHGRVDAVRLRPEDLRDCVVWEACALTVKHAVGRTLDVQTIAALIGEVQSGLRSGDPEA